MTVPIFRDYQRYCIDYVKQHATSGLFLDMGLGKTLITLTALKELAETNQLYGNILIVAPKAVALNTWADEIDKWSHLKGTSIDLLVGLSKKKRLEKYEMISQGQEPPKIYTINTELFSDCVTYFMDKNIWPFPTIVLDELQRFRSHKSNCTKSMLKLHRFNQQFIQQAFLANDFQLYQQYPLKRIIGLTGTPGPKGLINLWGEIACLDGGARLGKNITAFRNEYFVEGRRGQNNEVYEWIPKPESETNILKQIQDICISMKSDDKVQLPELIVNNIVVKMSKNERKVYDTLKKDKILPLLEETITAKNAGVLCAQLLQLANGAIYGELEPDEKKNDRKTYVVHDKKIEALHQIQEQAQDETLLVFYWFAHDLKRLKQAFPDAIEYDPKDRTIIKRWNNKEIPILLAHPSKIGIGTNLQQGGHIMVWFSLPMWNLELYQQSIKRLHRSGQKHTTIVHHLLTENTVDVDVLTALDEKARVQKESIIDPLDYKNPTLPHTPPTIAPLNDTERIIQIIQKNLAS